jgi:Predicted ABC-type transport system involved in lysophospholipase L1 biosynthesis, permease component
MSSLPWVLKMAWRDSRGSRKRLALYFSAMVLGVAALVAIRGFGENLTATVDREAKALLGADLRIDAEEPFDDSTEALIDSLGGRQARRVAFGSMALFPKTGDTRLTAVRAVEGDFPFYGTLETRPDSAARIYQQGRNALVAGSLMKQFDVGVGDSVRIGRVAYRIVGEIKQAPSESALSSPIYIPRAELDTSLLSRGSIAEYEPTSSSRRAGTSINSWRMSVRCWSAATWTWTRWRTRRRTGRRASATCTAS